MKKVVRTKVVRTKVVGTKVVRTKAVRTKVVRTKSFKYDVLTNKSFTKCCLNKVFYKLMLATIFLQKNC